MGVDKRKHARIPITAKVTRVDGDRNDFFFTKDLSIGGVFLMSDREVPIGTIVNLELAISGVKELISIRGKVVRIEKKEGKVLGLGIQFLDVDDDVGRNIRKLLDNS